ncbi:hypothetical protein BJP36_38080 [Moorena producens JHB]|uniref:Uncharacterized protein n=1 Tax=Moorena producens (strain JHB) TaxID=1454205 RepID=A0A9Q9UWI6_MOOP1|nr:hypothetical protein [Moorena producens]WAN69903.1 hypothetical protein BJP36_38080 [Moorena producens JHB]
MWEGWGDGECKLNRIFFPLPSSLLPAPKSLLRSPCSLLPKTLGALSVGELNSPRVAPQIFVPHKS